MISSHLRKRTRHQDIIPNGGHCYYGDRLLQAYARYDGNSSRLHHIVDDTGGAIWKRCGGDGKVTLAFDGYELVRISLRKAGTSSVVKNIYCQYEAHIVLELY